jgi:HSP20 family protein
MAVTHWNPLTEFMGLGEAMDRLFSEGNVRPNGANGRTARRTYDLYETADGLTFRFAVPGVRPEDVEVTVVQNTLSIKGSYPQPGEEQKDWIWHSRGLAQGGEFQYAFRLPSAVNADHAEATFENGVLTLHLPKAEAAKPRRIEISAASRN